MMNKNNFFLVMLLSFLTMGSVFAQAPQGVNYQGVATDSEGNVLSNQDVKVRLSLLNETPSGTEEWVETHVVTTDEFGLFCLILGEGERIDGIATLFEDVSWADSEKFLQIEMDLTAGDDFVLLGTNKIMSVPYALECMACDEVKNEKQTLEYDGGTGDLTLVTPNGDNSIVNIQQSLSYDEVTGDLSMVDVNGDIIGSPVSLKEGGFGGPGASYDFPNGLIGEYFFAGLGDDVTVPLGKVMFVTNSDAEMQIKTGTSATGGLISEMDVTTVPNMPMFPEGTVISDCNCSYFFTDVDPYVTPVLLDFINDDALYQVPLGFTLFLKSGVDDDDAVLISINGQTPQDSYKFLKPNGVRGTRIMTFPQETILRKDGNDWGHQRVYTGYLLAN